MVRKINRRHLVTLGFGFLAGAFWPIGFFRDSKKKQVTVDLGIDFPAGYTLAQYEYDVPSWAKNEELRAFIGAFMRDGRLLSYRKSADAAGVTYRFTFSSTLDLRAFIGGVRERGLVDFKSRSSRGLISVVRVDGVKLEC